MPQITFRGKIYRSEFEMPQEIRREYQDDQLKKAAAKSLTDVIDIPPEVKDAYKRAASKENNASATQSPNNLPTIEELYRRSAPEDMRHLPSDESILRPSPPVIDPDHSTIEPESNHWIVRVAYVILWALFAIVLIYLVTQWLW